ncbi:MAG TPA: polymer-forming cytoskeletal protein [Candidatus Saccharimonadales bacterium]|nr:polymer-forming cytoskeletal protein [Candidatus Saccharimonadales bacterium]
MRKLWLAAAIIGLLLPLGLARAAEFATNSNGDVTVPASEHHHNFYTAGQSITVDAATSGDLAAAGQTVVVNGNVENSLFAAGQTINLRGNVGNNLRAAGDNVTISGTINGDVFAAGSTVTVTKDAVVNGGLYTAGSNVVINGSVKGEVRSAGALTISGQTGSVTSYGELTVKKTGIVNGNVNVHAAQAATIETGGTVTGVNHFTLVKNRTNNLAIFSSFAALAGLLGSLILGLVLVFLLPKRCQIIVDKALSAPTAAIGYGLALLIVFPIAIFIIAITLIGLPLAMLLGLVWLLLAVLGGFIGKLAFGAWLYQLVTKKPAVTNWLTLLIGLVASALIGFIPFIGPLVKFAFFLLGLGALGRYFWATFRAEPTPALEAK